MNINLIRNAVKNALYFLYDERNSVIDEDLAAQYDDVILQLENAEKEFEN